MKSLTRPAMLQWVLVGILVVAPCVGQQYHLRPPDEVIPRSLFGLHIHHPEEASSWPEDKFGSLRLWDSSVTWAHVEPGHKGNLEYDRLDRQVSETLSHGADVFMNIGMSPTWASAEDMVRLSRNLTGVSSSRTNPLLEVKSVCVGWDGTAG